MEQRAGIALTVCAAALIGVLRFEIESRPLGPRFETAPVALPPNAARVLALSFRSVAADLLWIRFVQDTPITPADETDGTALATELRAIVALDPTFRAPYLHGSTLLSVLGSQPCSALEVVEEGIPRFPGDWRLSFQAGYVCFSELGDTECAELAAQLDLLPRLHRQLHRSSRPIVF